MQTNIDRLTRLFFKTKHRSNDADKHISELRDLPYHILYDIVVNQKELNCWNKLSAMIDYTYPAKEKLIDYESKKEKETMKEIRYCIKYASYAYFMPILGNPSGIIIEKEDKHLPFVGLKSLGIGKAGYFIAIDRKNKYILMCIRGTETIGDTLTDLDAHVKLENFGNDTDETDQDKMYNVHHGIYKAATKIEKDVTDKIKSYASKYPEYKILVTGHSLGAGITSLLGLLWKTKNTFKNDRFSCYSFASPLVIDYGGMIASLEGNNMISVAVTTDIITRLSVEGLIKLNERMKIIRKYNNYEDLIDEIVKARCLSEDYDEFYNKLGNDELRMINELKMQNSKDIRNDLELYPCGQLLWFMPEFLLNDKKSTKDKYNDLINLINWQCESSKFTQTLQFIYNIIGDFYVFDKNEVLTSVRCVSNIDKLRVNNISKPIRKQPMILNADISPDRLQVDRFELTQMVSYGVESFQAHFPGRYSTGFGINIYNIFRMSKYYQILKSIPIPESLLNISILIIIILVCILKISLQIITDVVSHLLYKI